MRKEEINLLLKNFELNNSKIQNSFGSQKTHEKQNYFE